MSGATANCPSCGAPIEFKIGASAAVVCSHCKSVVVRSDRGLENLGKVADVVGTDLGLGLHDRGVFRGRSFEVAGRLVLQHPAGGTWEEYFVHFDGRDPGWIAEAQGRWTVVMQVNSSAPPLNMIAVGQPVNLGTFGSYVVSEASEGSFLTAEGELPFAARPGSARKFADLSGANGACASIDYGDGTRAPLVYVGHEASLAELRVQRSGVSMGGPGNTKTKETKCPGCGAPLPLHASGSSRIACHFCGALSDLETNQVLSQQDVARAQPWIPLGSKGVLENIEWTVIGYVERYCDVEGERFDWQEYLFYSETEGFRWLVVDEGVCRFGKSMSPGDIDQRGMPHTIQARGATFRKRNGNWAMVSRVIGEFYWKVTIGERVYAEDFENRQWMISCEKAENEVNWTAAYVVPTPAIETAFKLQNRQAPINTQAAYANYGTPSRPSSSLVVMVVILVLFLVMLGACESACGGGSSGGSFSTSSGGIRVGSSSGGFGGK